MIKRKSNRLHCITYLDLGYFVRLFVTRFALIYVSIYTPSHFLFTAGVTNHCPCSLTEASATDTIHVVRSPHSLEEKELTFVVRYELDR